MNKFKSFNNNMESKYPQRIIMHHGKKVRNLVFRGSEVCISNKIKTEKAQRFIENDHLKLGEKGRITIRLTASSAVLPAIFSGAGQKNVKRDG